MKKNAHYVNKVMFLLLICFACTNAFSQAWVNVTDLYVQNSGFDEDLTWNADGSTKEIVKTTTISSTRSIAWEAADSSVYAHSAGTHTRTDGIPATSVFNGFIGRIKGWKLNTNLDYPKCEWILYGSLPYNLEEKAIPYEDRNPFFIEVPQKPTDNNSEDNIGFLYLRASWGYYGIYSQEMHLPGGLYRLEYRTININPSFSHGESLCQVENSGATYKDEDNIFNTNWTNHSIEFVADGDTRIQFGMKPEGGSSSNPFLIVDDIRLFSNNLVSLKKDTFIYTGKNPELEYTCYQGYQIVSYDETNLQKNVGYHETIVTFQIKATGQDEVFEKQVPISYTITPVQLTTSVGNYERTYNEDNPQFNINYIGFVEGEDENVLLSKPVANTIATKQSDTGTYPIDITGGEAENYVFIYQNGNLTINKAEQIVTWNQDLSKLIVNEQVELNAEASSGLAVSYIVEANNAVELYQAGTKSYLDCKAAGIANIRAVQEGNQNYYSSLRVNNVAVVQDTEIFTLTIVQAENGSLSTQVNKGETKTFNIKASEGWKIHSVVFNNEEVTELLNESGDYTTPAIMENSILSVVYESDAPTQSRSLGASKVTIQATSQGARVKNAAVGETIYVYSEDGVLQKTVCTTGTETDIPLERDGLYIIKGGRLGREAATLRA